MVKILDFIEPFRAIKATRVYRSRTVMASEENECYSSVKYRERERRLRRIQMRNMGLLSGSGSSAGDDFEGHKFAGTAEAARIISLMNITEAPPPPVVGTMAVIGRQRDMEDEISVQTDLCRPEINGYWPVHFLGVFDGHGGRHVSALCKENMHVILEEELMSMKAVCGGGGFRELWLAAINRSFERMDEMAQHLCLCGPLPDLTVCGCNPNLSLMGTAAMVAVLTQECVFVANCGDSRAVLCRDRKPIPLSVDHKTDQEDDRARIELAKGRIMTGDASRVEGILAMSRAIGDRLLKQWVISEPEIYVTRREPGDEFLILASEGLWDVVSNELACQMVHKCLDEDREGAAAAAAAGGAAYHSGSASAAALLVSLALGRRSTDNISVVVVDLKN